MFKINFESISRLVIYGNGKKLFEKERDLATVSTGNGGTLDRIVSFNLSQEPKNARKENLNRKDNYYLTYTPEYFRNERRTALYVHVSEIEVENLGEKIHNQHDGETDFIYHYKLIFKNGGTIRKVNFERLNVPDGWTIPEEEQKTGAHWSKFLGDYNNAYNIPSERTRKRAVENGLPDFNLIHWYITTEPLAENYYTGDYISRIERDDARKDREKIAEIISSCLYGNNTVSHYEVARMLQHLNITVKA